jgi:arsenite-transporting ATPase
LYTGKGGVGKTTVAAATALHLARSGKRVLAMSTDPAHSLGDSLGLRLGNAPLTVADNLDALEIDAMAEGVKAWKALREYLGEMLSRGRELTLSAEETLLFPGLSELFSLFRILEFADSGDYDVLVVDCAPTGETLSLLHYPERLVQLFETVLPAKRAAVKLLRRPLEALTRIPMPEDRLFDDITVLFDRLYRLADLLHDGDTTTLRLVTTPERIVVAEARRTYTWLTMYGFVVDAVVLNRIYPDTALRGYFAPWAQSQQTGIAVVTESFALLPLFRLELQDSEVMGTERLATVGELIYRDTDPAAVFYQGEFSRVVRSGDELQLRLRLPEADKSQLDLRQDGTDLLIAYRNEQRRIALPESLAGRQVASASYRDGELVLTMH